MKRSLMLLSTCLLAFAGCGRVEESGSMVNQDEVDVAMAEKLTGEAFAALSGRLMAAISSEGHVAAIGICSMEAAGLLDGVAESHGVTIRRVTDHPRNPENRADAIDHAVMEMMRTMPETLAASRDRSPDAWATGYRQGDLRGLWRVEFLKTTKP